MNRKEIYNELVLELLVVNNEGIVDRIFEVFLSDYRNSDFPESEFRMKWIILITEIQQRYGIINSEY